MPNSRCPFFGATFFGSLRTFSVCVSWVERFRLLATAFTCPSITLHSTDSLEQSNQIKSILNWIELMCGFFCGVTAELRKEIHGFFRCGFRLNRMLCIHCHRLVRCHTILAFWCSIRHWFRAPSFRAWPACSSQSTKQGLENFCASFASTKHT